MKKDGSWKGYFEDPARFADAINGFGCNDEQVDEYKNMEGRMNMYTAIKEMMEDSKSEGRMEGRMEILERQVQVKIARNESIEKIADDLVESVEVIQQIIDKLQ